MTLFKHSLAQFTRYDTVHIHFDKVNTHSDTVHSMFTHYDTVHSNSHLLWHSAHIAHIL